VFSTRNQAGDGIRLFGEKRSKEGQRHNEASERKNAFYRPSRCLKKRDKSPSIAFGSLTISK